MFLVFFWCNILQFDIDRLNLKQRLIYYNWYTPWKTHEYNHFLARINNLDKNIRYEKYTQQISDVHKIILIGRFIEKNNTFQFTPHDKYYLEIHKKEFFEIHKNTFIFATMIKS